jgi:hypothetical protein
VRGILVNTRQRASGYVGWCIVERFRSSGPTLALRGAARAQAGRPQAYVSHRNRAQVGGRVAASRACGVGWLPGHRPCHRYRRYSWQVRIICFAISTDVTRDRFGLSALPSVQTLLVTGSDYLLCHQYRRYSWQVRIISFAIGTYTLRSRFRQPDWSLVQTLRVTESDTLSSGHLPCRRYDDCSTQLGLAGRPTLPSPAPLASVVKGRSSSTSKLL